MPVNVYETMNEEETRKAEIFWKGLTECLDSTNKIKVVIKDPNMKVDDAPVK